MPTAVSPWATPGERGSDDSQLFPICLGPFPPEIRSEGTGRRREGSKAAGLSSFITFSLYPCKGLLPASVRSWLPPRDLEAITPTLQRKKLRLRQSQQVAELRCRSLSSKPRPRLWPLES